MPPTVGNYRYFVEYRQSRASKTTTGTFSALDGHRRGPIRVDAKYPWHFIWEGTGEHYFFNGTTAYWLIGWQDDNIIRSSIERLHNLKVNRLRVTIAGRTNLFYGEPVMTGDNWTLFVTPWPAQNAEDIFHPGFDYSRFDVDYWQKFDRALRYARDRDMIVSLVLDMNDGRVHPAAGSEDEYRFIRYAIDRFGAFSNITSGFGDDLDRYRNGWWTHRTGTLVKKWDPYHHLATSHPVHNVFQDRKSEWFNFTSFQEWSREQHSFMLSQRKEQEKLGRIIPQTNEEYGYEDHYPIWAGPLGIRFCRRSAPHRMGYCHGRRLPDHRRNGAPRDERVARHWRGVDEWPRRRDHDDAAGICAYGRLLYRFRLVDHGATR